MWDSDQSKSTWGTGGLNGWLGGFSFLSMTVNFDSRFTISPCACISSVQNTLVKGFGPWNSSFRVFDTQFFVFWKVMSWLPELFRAVFVLVFCCDLKVSWCLILLLGNLLMCSPLRETNLNYSLPSWSFFLFFFFLTHHTNTNLPYRIRRIISLRLKQY